MNQLSGEEAMTSRFQHYFSAKLQFHMINICARENYKLLLHTFVLNVCGTTKQTMYAEKCFPGKGKLLCLSLNKVFSDNSLNNSLHLARNNICSSKRIIFRERSFKKNELRGKVMFKDEYPNKFSYH